MRQGMQGRVWAWRERVKVKPPAGIHQAPGDQPANDAVVVRPEVSANNQDKEEAWEGVLSQ